MNRDIRATVAHILSAVRLEIHWLNNHKTLDIRRLKKFWGIDKGRFQDVPKDLAHFFCPPGPQKKAAILPLATLFGSA